MSKSENNGTEGKKEEQDAISFLSDNRGGGDNTPGSLSFSSIEPAIKNQLDEAIAKLKLYPNVINEIIEEKKKAELGIAKAAQEFHEALAQDIVEDWGNRQSNVNQFKDNKKAIEILERDQAKIEEIQSYIAEFQKNVGKGVSYERDKKTDEAQYNELLMTSSTSNRQGKITISGKNNTTETVEVHSLEQLEARSKQIDLMHKTWKGLSQVRNDDDRSIWYSQMSDNLASGVMTGINTGRQGMAFAQALLTYAVADVLWDGIKGAAKGLVTGAKTGYKGTSAGIKSAANAMYVYRNHKEKHLEGLINNIIAKNKQYYLVNENIAKSFQDNNFLKTSELLLNNINQKIETLQLANNIDNVKIKKYQDLHKKLFKAVKEAKQFIKNNQNQEYKTPSMQTKVAARAAGVVGAVVGAICNTIWEGVKNPALAVWDIKDKVQNHYDAIKPAEGTSWNKTYSQVQEEQQNKQIAKTMVKYAKKTNKAKFTEMVTDRKAEAKKGKGSDVQSI